MLGKQAGGTTTNPTEEIKTLPQTGSTFAEVNQAVAVLKESADLRPRLGHALSPPLSALPWDQPPGQSTCRAEAGKDRSLSAGFRSCNMLRRLKLKMLRSLNQLGS